MALKLLIFLRHKIFINPENTIIIKSEIDINKNNSSGCWKLKNSEVLLNISISDILFGLLIKDIKGTIVPIVINSSNEFMKITNIIKINLLFVCLFKYEINSNILIKSSCLIYRYFKWSVVNSNIGK